jgi:hypothetical protein
MFLKCVCMCVWEREREFQTRCSEIIKRLRDLSSAVLIWVRNDLLPSVTPETPLDRQSENNKWKIPINLFWKYTRDVTIQHTARTVQHSPMWSCMGCEPDLLTHTSPAFPQFLLRAQSWVPNYTKSLVNALQTSFDHPDAWARYGEFQRYCGIFHHPCDWMRAQTLIQTMFHHHHHRRNFMLRNSADGVRLQTPANVLHKLRNSYEIHSMNSRHVLRSAEHTNNL